ncbi:MAG TPA: hypothetical protein VLE89_08225 [Chlamydiales bacterium]|nr:hypothetical protein [Chlamydiales bacterium]
MSIKPIGPSSSPHSDAPTGPFGAVPPSVAPQITAHLGRIDPPPSTGGITAHLQLANAAPTGPRFAVLLPSGEYYFIDPKRLTVDQTNKLAAAAQQIGNGTHFDLNLDHLILNRNGQEYELDDESDGVQELRTLYREILGKTTFPWHSYPRGARGSANAPEGFVRRSGRCANLEDTDQDTLIALSHPNMDAANTPLNLHDKMHRLKRKKAAHILFEHADRLLNQLERTAKNPAAIPAPNTTEGEGRLRRITDTQQHLKGTFRFGVCFEAMHPLSIQGLNDADRKDALVKKEGFAEAGIQRHEVPKKTSLLQAPYLSLHQKVDAQEEKTLAKQCAAMGAQDRKENRVCCRDLGIEETRETPEFFFTRLIDKLVQDGKPAAQIRDEAIAMIQSPNAQGQLVATHSFKLAFGYLTPADQTDLKAELIHLCDQMSQLLAEPSLLDTGAPSTPNLRNWVDIHSTRPNPDQALLNAFELEIGTLRANYPGL